MSELRGVLFDVDGTLVDTNQILWDSWVLALREYDVDLQVSFDPDFVGVEAEETAKRFIEKYNIYVSTLELVKKRIEKIESLLDKSEIELNIWVLELLEILKNKKVRMGVYTNARKKDTIVKLQKAGIYDYFEFIIGKEDVKNRKPAPDGYLLGLEKIKLPTENCVVFEDSLSGLKAANSAGLKCLIHSNFDKGFENADLVFNNIDEVLNWLKVNYNFKV